MTRRRPRNRPAAGTADQALAKARTRDGFENLTARIGLGADNQLAKSVYSPNKVFTQVELDDMYRTSWVVGRAVEVVAEDMVRAGLEFSGPLPPEQIDELHKAWQAAGLPGRLSDTIKWARLYGGALAVILIDGQQLDQPLDLDSIGKGSFRGLTVFDRYQVTPSTEVIKELGPMLGYPEFYTVEGAEGINRQKIHHSRCLRFIGIELPYRERQREQGWGASVVERAFTNIMSLDSATYGAANLMFKSFLRVIGVKDLRRILAQGGAPEQGLMKMMEMVRQMQSNEGITLLDSEDQFSAINWNFAGVYDALQAFAEQISGAFGIPLVRLLGQSPKGFSSGDADLQMYRETISTAQEDDMRGPIGVLLEVLCRSKWGKPPPTGLSFSFAPLASPSALEKSQIATADAQTVAALFAGGVIDKPQALEALRESGRITGRFANIRAADIDAARAEITAPPLPTLPELPEPVAPGASNGN